MHPEDRHNEEEIMRSCADCGDDYREEELEYSNTDGDLICDDCRDNYVDCYSCSNTLHNDNSYYSDYQSDYYCESCYYEAHFYCESCDCDYNYDEDDGHYDDAEGMMVCSNCYEQHISEAHWEVSDSIENLRSATPESLNGIDRYKQPQSYDRIKSRRRVGIEIEHYSKLSPEEMNSELRSHFYHTGFNSDINPEFVTGLWDRTKERINTLDVFEEDYSSMYRQMRFDSCGTDGSLHSGNKFDYDDVRYSGVEIDMLPRRGDYLSKDIHIMCKTLTSEIFDGKVDASCGQHIHIDTRDFDWYHRVYLSVLYNFLEPHLYSFLPSSRHSTRYCQKMSHNYKAFYKVTDRDEFVNVWYDTERFSNSRWCGKRYYGLNHHPSLRGENPIGSTELRYHSGTLNPIKMEAWVILHTQLFDFAKEQADILFSKYGNDAFGKKLLGFYEETKPELEKYDGEKHYSIPSFFSKSDIIHLKRLRKEAKVFPGEFRQELSESEKDTSIYNVILDRYNYRLNPIIDINTLFKAIDIPSDVVSHFRNRLFSNMANRYTIDTHYYRCFENRVGVVSLESNGEYFEYNVVNSEFDKMYTSNLKDFNKEYKNHTTDMLKSVEVNHYLKTPSYSIKSGLTSNHIPYSLWNTADTTLSRIDEYERISAIIKINNPELSGVYNNMISPE